MAPLAGCDQPRVTDAAPLRDYSARVQEGPRIIQRAQFGDGQEFLTVAVPSPFFAGNPRFDTHCFVFRDAALGTSSVACKDSLELTEGDLQGDAPDRP